MGAKEHGDGVAMRRQEKLGTHGLMARATGDGIMPPQLGLRGTGVVHVGCLVGTGVVHVGCLVCTHRAQQEPWVWKSVTQGRKELQVLILSLSE